MRSIRQPVGRGPKLGDATGCAPRCQPPLQGEAGGLSGIGQVFWLAAMRHRDIEARNTVADLPQADAEAGSRGRAVKACFTQRANQDFALLLVQIRLKVSG